MKRVPTLVSACLLCLAAVWAQPLLAQQTAQQLAQQASEQETEISEAELDQLLAPIALYPDSVLSHVLIAATYPLEVVMAERWTRDNPELRGDEAVAAVEGRDWDPSVKALVAFPDLLQRMSTDLNWTEQVGEAFLSDEERILDRVQYLRQQAYDSGSLQDLEHLSVSRDEKRHIVIEPVVREVVYIPYYDTRVVYGSWWWDDYPPVYWHHHHHHHDRLSWYWGPRVHISSRFYFSAFRWDTRRVVVIHQHHHRDIWRARQIARHRDAYYWRHDPYHRRGAQYRNPRTRDYFERRHREGARSVQPQPQPRLRSELKQEQLRRQLSSGRELRSGSREQSSRQIRQDPRREVRSSERAPKALAPRGEAPRPAPATVQRAPRAEAQPRRSEAPRKALREQQNRSGALIKRESGSARAPRDISNRSSLRESNRGAARSSREASRSSPIRNRQTNPR